MEYFSPRDPRSLTEYEDKPTCSSNINAGYHKLHNDACYMICTIPHMTELMTRMDAKAQFQWLTNLHDAIDQIKGNLNFWKVDIAGETLQFSAGAPEWDPCPPRTLFTLAKRLMRLSHDPRMWREGRPFRFCMGLDCGTVSSAILGDLAWKYGIFGGPVTFAVKLEQASAPGFLRISESAYERLYRRHEDDRMEWEDGGMIDMMDDCQGQTYIYRDPTLLPDVSPDEMRKAYSVVDAAWTPEGVTKAVWKDPTITRLFQRYVESHMSPADDIRSIERILWLSMVCPAIFALGSWLGLPNWDPPMDITSRHHKGGLSVMAWLLLAGLLVLCVFVINILEMVRGPNNKYKPNCGAQTSRMGYIMLLRGLLAMPVLAHALAFLPQVLIAVLPVLVPDWRAVASAAGKMTSQPSMCPAGPAWVQAFVTASPISVQQSLADVLAQILPPIMQLVEVLALMGLELSQQLAMLQAAATSSLKLDVLQAVPHADRLFSVLASLGFSALLASPLAIFSIIVPVRLSDNLLFGWLPVLVAFTSTLFLGVAERWTPWHILVTVVVGWVVPLVLQYYRLERPLEKPFLAAIM
eukprot:jgi/Botrbrau1/5983/Bobra.104_1s0014.1